MKEFSFNFDITIVEKLRNKINEKLNITVNKVEQYNYKNNTIAYFSWNKICAILDRITDTIKYINSIFLGKNRNIKSAFDFYDFLNNEYVVIECIESIAKIYKLDNEIKNIKISNTSFNFNINGKEIQDSIFFEFIRSICSVHPISTNNKMYKDILGNSEFYCCPFVMWSESVFLGHCDDERDLQVTIYTFNKENERIDIPLYIANFEKYLKKWIDLIPLIIRNINEFNKEKIIELSKEKISLESNFNTYIEYVRNLKNEYIKRCTGSYENLFDDCILFFKINLSNQENSLKLDILKNCLKHSLNFIHKSLQDMKFNGFKYTGIKGKNNSTNLFIEISSHFELTDEFRRISQYIKDYSYLNPNIEYDSTKKSSASISLKMCKDFINKYVFFEGNENDEEKYVLICLARFLHNVKYKKILKNNIPKKFLSFDKKITKY